MQNKPTKKAKTFKVKKSHVLVLRTNSADMTSYNGFKWPMSGKCTAPDFESTYACGAGLHGFLWGEGDGSLANLEHDAKWLVVQVEEKSILHGKGSLIGKCKFQTGEVVFVGDRMQATDFLKLHAPLDKVIVGGTATAGDSGTVLIKYWDSKNNRYRIAIGYVGEDGILPKKTYIVQDGKLILKS